jgi:hypothetical protein
MWHVWDTIQVHTGLRWGNLRERGHLEYLGVDGRKILKMDLQEVGWGGMDGTDLAQDRDRWRELVNAEMNLHVPHKAEIRLAESRLASPEGLCPCSKAGTSLQVRGL